MPETPELDLAVETQAAGSEESTFSREDRIKLHGRRIGRPLRSSLQRLVDEVLPQVKLDLPEADQKIDLEKAFDRNGDVWLEIGFGGGEHLAWHAQRNRDVNFIGAEIYLNGVATLLRELERMKASHVRVVREDARMLVDALPDACLTRAFLLFPDPWPKSRHAKRRYVQPDTLDDLARVMKDGAEFRLATDNAVYLEWSLAHLMDHPDFEWLAEDPEDWRSRERCDDWPQTRYEAKRLAGEPRFLRFCRKLRG